MVWCSMETGSDGGAKGASQVSGFTGPKRSVEVSSALP